MLENATKAPNVQISNLEEGDCISMTQYFTVVRTTATLSHVKNQAGQAITISNSIVEDATFSSSQYDEEKEATQTQLAALLMGAGDIVFTVNFDKQAGEVRTLVGHLHSTEPTLGRTQAIDLLVTEGNQFRWVDHRTINWLILKNVRYTLKTPRKRKD